MTHSAPQRTDSTDINCLEDIEPPFNTFLSGKYKRSFAFKTIKDRLPVILTQIIDSLSRNKEDIAKKYGEDSAEDIKKVIGAISKLKNEMVTNKALIPLIPAQGKVNDDYEIWNKVLQNLSDKFNETQTWYNTIWLICECYMYRRLAQEFSLTKSLKNYDPFEIQKQEGYFQSIGSIKHLSKHIVQLCDTKDQLSLKQEETTLVNLMKLDLWGNRCDLSLSSGIVSTQEQDPLSVLNDLDKEIIVDNTKDVWELLNNKRQHACNSIIDFVLDNAGYELFTDLCLAIFLINKNFTQRVRFYVKRYPWFVSDVTTNDFHWLIETMKNSNNENIKLFGGMCDKELKTGSITIQEESFWTEPFDYSEMPKSNPSLYKKLSQSLLIIFKGDLNYRKLLGDFNWKHTTDFLQSLRGFRPTSLVSLRTVKADLIAGLAEGQSEVLNQEDNDWMRTGRIGIIQASIV